MSLRSSAARGTRNANHRRSSVAPPKRATAASGVTLGGCGTSRLAAARRIKVTRNQNRGRFIFHPLEHRLPTESPSARPGTPPGASGGAPPPPPRAPFLNQKPPLAAPPPQT